MRKLHPALAACLIAALTTVGCASTEIKPTEEIRQLKGTIEVYSEDVADYNTKTGSGCKVTTTPNNVLESHILCRSKHSGEHAWNAVTARSKKLCASKKWTMLFKRPPSLLKEKGAYGAQMDIVCIE